MSTSARIEVDATEFVASVKGALAVADKDESLPAVCAVHLEVVDGGRHLAVVGTDRFTLAALLVKVRESGGVEEGWNVTWPRADAEAVVKAYGSVKRMPLAIRREDDEAPVEVEVPGTSTRFSIRPQEAQFPPNWLSLMAGSEGDEFGQETVAAVVSEDKLESLRRARRSPKDEMEVEFRTGALGYTRLVRVTLGNYGVGVLMPKTRQNVSPLEVLGIK